MGKVALDDAQYSILSARESGSLTILLKVISEYSLIYIDEEISG